MEMERGNAQINKEFIIFGNPPSDSIVVITGLARSGTTATAQLFNSFMPLKWDLIRNMELEGFNQAIWTSDKVYLDNLASHNPERFAVKIPLGFRKASLIQESFGSRLVWVVVIRDVVGKALREKLSMGGFFAARFREAWEESEEIRGWINQVMMESDVPLVLMSYPAVTCQKGYLREELYNWMGLSPVEK